MGAMSSREGLLGVMIVASVVQHGKSLGPPNCRLGLPIVPRFCTFDPRAHSQSVERTMQNDRQRERGGVRRSAGRPSAQCTDGQEHQEERRDASGRWRLSLDMHKCR